MWIDIPSDDGEGIYINSDEIVCIEYEYMNPSEAEVMLHLKNSAPVSISCTSRQLNFIKTALRTGTKETPLPD